jgi:hypothetical protein
MSDPEEIARILERMVPELRDYDDEIGSRVAEAAVLVRENERLRAALRSIAAGTSAIPIETARAALSGGES